MPLDSQTSNPSRADKGLAAVLRHLKADGYRFITPTPVTHRRVIGRREMARARDLRGVFGWSLPFDAALLPDDLLRALHEAEAVVATDHGLRSRVRVSSLGDDLFLHSAFPPQDEDAIFFGPDTYRFARFLESACDGRDIGLAIDIGVGSGAGAAVLARRFRPQRLMATDVNPQALRLAGVNLSVAGVTAELRLADGLAGVEGPADLIVANPPYIAGEGDRTYRDGGDMHGARRSLDWTLSAARLLAPAGRMLLYTGSAVVDGRDALLDSLSSELDPAEFRLTYAEIDPDVFGEQLDDPAYRDVERIAAIGAVVERVPA